MGIMISSGEERIIGSYEASRVWEKTHPISGYDPAEWRWDDLSNVIYRQEHGNRNSPFGWEIDHIWAKILSGSDDPSNLRPLHYAKNASLGGILGNLAKA
jgi:hypothetical protein